MAGHAAPDFLCHDPGLGFAVRGLAGTARLTAMLHGGFSDTAYPIAQVVAQDDRVLVHLHQIATHSSAQEGAAATGRRTDIVVMDLCRVRDGPLVEHRAQMDDLSLLNQIGAIAD